MKETMRFNRSSGLTPSEKLLAELCDHSFLSMWSYPNPQRKRNKELCDLIVIFGDDVILFSDKSCAYLESGNAAIDWSRWYRNSIYEPAGKFNRAEQWLKNYPEQVFLDVKCTIPLPVKIPSAERICVHRICIAIGAEERNKAETGTSELTVSARVADGDERFTVGMCTTSRGFVHVFEEKTLPILLSELSTTADFLDYLRKKETLFQSGQFEFAESELDLLGYFLWHNRAFPDHGADRFRLDPNLWEKVQADPQFLAGREENKISYFWDGLIKYLTDLYMKETLEFGNEMTVEDYECGVRIMAAENRFSRRLLAKWILERAEMAPDGYVGSLHPSPEQDAIYVLLIGPGSNREEHLQYRKARAEQLYARCIAGKAAQPGRRYIIGIAMDARGVKGTSEDFIYIDTKDWTAEAFDKAEELRQELGYFVEGKASFNQVTESEYPDSID